MVSAKAVLDVHGYKWGFPKIRGTILGGPHNKDYNILGSIYWGPPILGNYQITSLKLQQQPNHDRVRGPRGLVVIVCASATAIYMSVVIIWSSTPFCLYKPPDLFSCAMRLSI